MNLDFQNGEIILIDKELNWTSFDVVSKLRNSIKKKLDLQNTNMEVAECELRLQRFCIKLLKPSIEKVS